MNDKCSKCGNEHSCTKQYKEHRNGNGEVQDTRTEFSQWLTLLKYPFCSRAVVCNNLDFVWFRYDNGTFITIEEKRYGKSQSSSQFEVQRMMRDMMTFASNHAEFQAKTDRGLRPIYLGHYLVIFENTCPDDSSWVDINGARYTDVATSIKYLLYYGIVSIETVDKYKLRKASE